MSQPGASPRADINVTPLIDVLLVLLVIFLATMPLTEQSLDTSLPARTQPVGTPARTDQIVLRYESSGALSINQQPTTLGELPQRLREIYASRVDKTMYILGDPILRYRAIVQVMDIAKGAGVARVGIITEGMRRS